MCFHSKQSKEATQLEHRFKAKFESNFIAENSTGIYNGFAHPFTPIISIDKPAIITLAEWGLLPTWADKDKFKANTLNAKIETLSEKPTFKPYIQNRCLILTDGFWEWKWLDEKGKNKEKYLITLPDESPFAFAGIYTDWVDKSTGEMIRTYTIITTQANELMSEIHNTKKRMPVILTKENEKDWINGIDYEKFKQCKIELKVQLENENGLIIPLW